MNDSLPTTSRRGFLKLVGVLGAASAIAGSLSACGTTPANRGTTSAAGGASSGAGNAAGTITAAISYELGTNGFDPMTTSAALTVAANWHTMEGLTEILPSGNREVYAALGKELPKKGPTGATCPARSTSSCGTPTITGAPGASPGRCGCTSPGAASGTPPCSPRRPDGCCASTPAARGRARTPAGCCSRSCCASPARTPRARPGTTPMPPSIGSRSRAPTTTAPPGRSGPRVGPGCDESKVAEVGDGGVLLHARSRPRRRWAVSADGGESFTAPVPHPALVDPGCNGGLCRWGEVLVCSLLDDERERRRLVLRTSADGGVTWSRPLLAHGGAAGYSALAPLADGALGLLYESGDYAELVFRRITRAALGLDDGGPTLEARGAASDAGSTAAARAPEVGPR